MKKIVFIFIFTLNFISFSAGVSVSSSQSSLRSEKLCITIYKPNITITREFGESINTIVDYKIWEIERDSSLANFSGDIYGAVYGTASGYSLGPGINSSIDKVKIDKSSSSDLSYYSDDGYNINNWKDFYIRDLRFKILPRDYGLDGYNGWYDPDYVPDSPETIKVYLTQRISIPWNINNSYQNEDYPVMVYTWADETTSDIAGNLRIITIPKVEIEDIDFGKIYVNEQTDTISKTGNITISGNPGTNVNISILNRNFKLRKNNGTGEISAYAGILIGLNNISTRILETSIGNSGVLTSGLKIELENLFQVPEGVYQGDVTVNISFN